MKKILRFSLFLAFLLALANQAYAQPGGKISIQGVLKDANGTTVPDGPYTVTFKLYDAVMGGNEKWKEIATLDVIAGVYSHYLGSVTQLDIQDFKSTLFLEVQIGSSVMTPRTELSYAPYSLTVAAAQAAMIVKCSGAVGDVKYSILKPAQFAQENGSCWVPMDGRTLATTDRLREKWGIVTLPDASGLFLRGHEFVGGADNDPGREPLDPVGELQLDSYKEHDHTIQDPGHTHGYQVKKYTSRTADGDQENTYLEPDFDYENNTTSNEKTGIEETDSTGGAETRPKNLSLYIYIRIN
jgi:hypothetical protein